MVDASTKRSNLVFLALVITLNAFVLSIVCPESMICLPIVLLGSLGPFSVKFVGGCLEILVDKIRSVRHTYLLPHVHVN